MGQEQNNQAPVNTEFQETQDLVSLMTGNTGNGVKVAEKVIADLKNQFPNQQPAQQTPPPPPVNQVPPQNQQQQAAPVNQQQNNTPPPPPQTGQEPPAQQPMFIDTPLGKMQVGNNPQQQPGATVVNTFDEAFALAVPIMGMEIKTAQEFYEKGVPVIKGWRDGAAKAGEYKTSLESLQNDIKAAPGPIKTAFQAYLMNPSGNDWQSYVKTEKVLTFNEPVDKVEKELLVNHYYPGKYTAEQLQDKENGEVQMAIQSAEKLYGADKDKKKALIDAQLIEAQQYKTTVSASLTQSIEKAGEYLPVMLDEGKVAEVKQIMEGGFAQVASLFVNPDGTWKTEAGAMLLMAKNGTESIKALAGSIQKRVETQVNEEIVERGATSKVKGSGAGTVAEISKEEKELLEMMTPAKPKY